MTSDIGPATRRDVFAEDFAVGDTLDLGEYNVTEEEIVSFASRWDPQYFHTDPERAKRDSPLGLIASGLHTMCIFQRLAVLARTDEWHVIGGTGISGLQLRRPVRPGDTLRGTTVIEAVRLEPDRGRGLITHKGTVVNQSGEVVMVLQADAYVQARPPAPHDGASPK